MNKQRREQLRTAIEHLNEALEVLNNASSILEDITEEERNAYDNLPESLQYSERGETWLDNADKLDYHIEILNNCAEEINDIINELEEL